MTKLSGGCPARGCTRVVRVAPFLLVAVCVRLDDGDCLSPCPGSSSAERQFTLKRRATFHAERQSKRPCCEPSADAMSVVQTSGEDSAASTIAAEYNLQTRRPKAILHIVGDTHGDENYLFRTLVSTGRFVAEEGSLKWRPGIDESDDFEVIILGDMSDRGSKSRQNLLTLKKLAEDLKWGHRLVILLGNHEEMLLTHDLRYASGDLSGEVVSKAITMKEETDDSKLMQWLRGLPVVHLKHGVLMMHGGLGQRVFSALFSQTNQCAADDSTPSACGDALVANINQWTHAFLLSVDECIKHGSMEPQQCATGLRPSFLSRRLGVLWYRGYSSLDTGAGTEHSCGEAHGVAKAVGARAMAVAHTTHEKIHMLCGESTPVFLTDTHFQHCAERGECDYQAEDTFHEHTLDPNSRNVPQSLQVTVEEGGSMAYKRCLSKVDHGQSEIVCLPVSS